MFGYEVESIMGYELKTTFWGDFTVADAFGPDAVEDTYKQSFKFWKSDVEYITELAMVLNWKCWQHWQNGNDVLGKLYHDLYYKIDAWCYENLKGEDLKYYFETTD